MHNVTAATRLLDVLDLLARDTRIQVEFTVTGSSSFTAGTERFLLDQGIQPVPWENAVLRPYELAISASHGGDQHQLNPPLIILPHGMGYNKLQKPGNRETGKPGNRETGKPGNRETGKPGNRETVFGLSPEWLMVDGKVVPSSLVLSHPEQCARLALSCPDAVETVVLAGDPCFDRMLASVPLRPAYRRALGVLDGQRLLVISSTWGAESLFGEQPELVVRCAAELRLDDYRIVVALHPNVWYWHSPWSLRMWSETARRAGVLLLPPQEGWRAALIGADAVLGDHGSVTFYGAALGRPTLLAVARPDTVAPESAVGRFVRAAPRLAHDRPIAPQLESVMEGHDPAREPLASITAMTTSAPGSAMRLLRAEFYGLLRLSEPDTPADTRAVPLPAEAAGEPGAQVVRVEMTRPDTARITRWPAEPLRLGTGLPAGSHLSVDVSEPYRRFLDLAEIVVVPDARDAGAVLASLPGCLLATGPLDAQSWLVVCPDSRVLRFTGITEQGRVCASLVHAWLTAGHPLSGLPARISLCLGRRVVTVEACHLG